MMSCIGAFSIDSRRPIILSASRTAETSGVVTTSASSAPAAALRKPASMPAGLSMSMKSKSGRSCAQSSSICSAETASLVFDCAVGIM